MAHSEREPIPGAGRALLGLGLGVVGVLLVAPFDASWIDWAHGLEATLAARSPQLNESLKQWTQAFGRIEGGIACGVLLFALGRRGGAWRRRVATLALALVLVGVYVAAFKMAVGRARPGPAMRATGSYETLIEGPVVAWRDPQFRSFPSGHTASAAAAAAVIAAYHPGLMPVVWTLTAVVGAERVYDAKHYPTDVVAGGFVGWWTGWFCVAARGRGLTMPWEGPEEEPNGA